MEEFTVIYKILRALRAQMDYEERSGTLSAERFKVSEAKFNRLIGMLLENGYVSGVIKAEALDRGVPEYNVSGAEITLKGLEYLADNTMMQKVQRTLKGIKDSMPGI